jgi:hypothetical protein
MSEEKFDKSQPILVMIRRGRGGRGFLISPVDNVLEVAACADAGEIGELIVEMLDDEKQPRVNIDQLLKNNEKALEKSKAEKKENDEDDDDKPWYDVSDSDNPTDQLLFNGINALIGKAKSVSRPSRRHRRHGRSPSK